MWAAMISRSIPACAGEPPNAPATIESKGVYPRVCGGTHPICGLLIFWSGLSPRVRGNRIYWRR